VAGVPDRQLQVGARPQTGKPPNLGTSQLHRLQLDFQHPSLLPHGMGGIGAQVYQYLVDLGRVGFHRAASGANVLADFDRARQGGPQQPQRLLENESHIDRFALLPALPAEGENLFDQVPGALGTFKDFLKLGLKAGLAGCIQFGQLGVAMMALRMLLKSWAIPPARVPTASSFCAWRSWASRERSWVASRLMDTKLMISPERREWAKRWIQTPSAYPLWSG